MTSTPCTRIFGTHGELRGDELDESGEPGDEPPDADRQGSSDSHHDEPRGEKRSGHEASTLSMRKTGIRECGFRSREDP